MLPTSPIETFAPDSDLFSPDFSSLFANSQAGSLTQMQRNPAFSLQQPTQNGLYGSVPATDNSFFPWNMPWESSLASSLTTASHNDLCNVNATYTNLFHAFTVAKEQLSTLQVAFNTLSKSVTQSRSEASTSPLSTSLSTELADRKDPRLSKIHFWDRQTSAPRGNKRMAADINVMTNYIEKEDESIISGKEAQEIRATQLVIYRDIQRACPEDLPKTWGAASLAVITYHRAHMYAAHPILRLCSGHWKVERLATQTYSSWYTAVL
ncbi:hypothetical protein R3P38DRAFT_3213957 [Favolaschia claudopus]|uniref:Uncharacterized protein n=1 Tax=Favolaschia claudopus TaxID=2862362 RepID=A0AAW0ACL9_9AGAR